MEHSYEVFETKIKEKGVTAYRVGQETGINPVVFSEWKKGKSKPKFEKLFKIATYFGCDVTDFLDKEE